MTEERDLVLIYAVLVATVLYVAWHIWLAANGLTPPFVSLGRLSPGL